LSYAQACQWRAIIGGAETVKERIIAGFVDFLYTREASLAGTCVDMVCFPNNYDSHGRLDVVHAFVANVDDASNLRCVGFCNDVFSFLCGFVTVGVETLHQHHCFLHLINVTDMMLTFESWRRMAQQHASEVVDANMSIWNQLRTSTALYLEYLLVDR
jgi:hypothetical protein